MAVETDSDRTASYFDADEFGTTAVVGANTDVPGMFTDDYVSFEFGESNIDSTAPQFICNLSDVADVATGQTVTVASVAYIIRSIERDSGLVTLVLRKTT